MKIIGKVTIKKDGVVIKPLGPAEWTIGVDLAREVPYDSVSQAERRGRARMTGIVSLPDAHWRVLTWSVVLQAPGETVILSMVARGATDARRQAD